MTSNFPFSIQYEDNKIISFFNKNDNCLFEIGSPFVYNRRNRYYGVYKCTAIKLLCYGDPDCPYFDWDGKYPNYRNQYNLNYKKGDPFTFKIFGIRRYKDVYCKNIVANGKELGLYYHNIIVDYKIMYTNIVTAKNKEIQELNDACQLVSRL